MPRNRSVFLLLLLIMTSLALTLSGCFVEGPYIKEDAGNHDTPNDGKNEKDTDNGTDTGTDKDTDTDADTDTNEEPVHFEGDEKGECDDDADNDRDGLFDCDDDGCIGSKACIGESTTDSIKEDKETDSVEIETDIVAQEKDTDSLQEKETDDDKVDTSTNTTLEDTEHSTASSDSIEGTDSEENNTDGSDTGSDTHILIDSDTNTCTSGTECPCTDDVWFDEETKLCWQNPPSENTLQWGDAIKYCEEGSWGEKTDWRLPKIDELISLIRGCQDGQEGGAEDKSLCTMTPPECEQDDICAEKENCRDCDYLMGPDTNSSGCYWVPKLIGKCNYYWSSSSYAVSSLKAWRANFFHGQVSNTGKTSPYNVRCVRGPW